MARKTPRYGHEPIKMRRVREDLKDNADGSPGGYYEGCESIVQRGDFFWDMRKGKRTLMLGMPSNEWGPEDSRRDFMCAPWSIDYKNTSNASWSWDGNEDEPTLSPSLHAVGVWHGFVKGGVLKEA